MHTISTSICVILIIAFSCAAPGPDPVAKASPTPIPKADPTPEAKAEAAPKSKAEARAEPIPILVPIPSYWPSPLSAFGLYKPFYSAYSIGGLECPKYGYYPRGYGSGYGYAHPWW